MAGPLLDLGDQHLLRWIAWRPDRELNPRYRDVEDVERFGAVVYHLQPDGAQCGHGGSITLRGETQDLVAPDVAKWDVVSWDPLTLSPSLLCTACGDHGFITDGKWVRA